jgi:hypothetical protein
MVSHCAQLSHPPTHWHAETCHEPGRGPSDFPHFALRGAVRLSFTARIEGAHSDRAASASKKDGLAAPLPPFRGRALHEHRRASSLPSHAPSKLACFSSPGMAPVLVPLRPSSEHLPIFYTSPKRRGRGCPLLRASSDHCFIVGALRARRAPGRSSPIHFCLPGMI